VLQTVQLLRSVPSLVDVNVPDGSHFTVCGDVHGQVFKFFECIAFVFFLVLLGVPFFFEMENDIGNFTC
jgi:hypothetical protein